MSFGVSTTENYNFYTRKIRSTPRNKSNTDNSPANHPHFSSHLRDLFDQQVTTVHTRGARSRTVTASGRVTKRRQCLRIASLRAVTASRRILRTVIASGHVTMHLQSVSQYESLLTVSVSVRVTTHSHCLRERRCKKTPQVGQQRQTVLQLQTPAAR